MEKRREKEAGKQVAGKQFDFKDYQNEDEISTGLAITHEQVSDDYTEGTIDGHFENIEDIDLKSRLKENRDA